MKPATKFYLNRILYSSKEYPLTYSVYLQNLRSQFPEKLISIKRLKYLFIIFIGIFLLFSILLPTHIYMTNAIFGPYHLTLPELIKHVKDYKKNGETWKFYRMEYIQVEFGEGNILNPETINNKTQNIRRYSDPWKKDRHISTYKKLKNPKMYIKLPTKNLNHFHSEFPFDFTKFSYETLKCILRILLQPKSQEDLNNLEFNEKINIFYFIKNEYSKNVTEFNIRILTKCGILIGFLYKPMYEIAFLPSGRYLFSPNDIALDATQQYFSTYILYVLIICCILFLGVFLYTFFFVIQFYVKRFQFKIFERYGLFSATKYVFNKNVEDELWLLNLPGNIYEQIIQLDELINRSKHKYSKIAIIKLPNGHLYVVFSSVDHVDVNNFEERPFTICPVSDIRRIVSEGIYCINDSNVKVQLRWPSKSLLKEDYRAEWLHSELLEISEEYREHYDFLIHVWHLHEKQVDEIKEPTMFRFMFFLNEEKNIHRLMLQRLSFYNHFFMDFNANDSFDTIAIFRVLEELHRNFVDETLKNEKCLICLDGLNFGERYSKWPCQSLIPHRFHFECMLKWLRTNNRCPLCQQPAKLFLNSNN